MNREDILAFLKANPNFTVGRCAHHLKVTEMEVTKAQLSTLKNLDRSSKMWGKLNESVIKK